MGKRYIKISLLLSVISLLLSLFSCEIFFSSAEVILLNDSTQTIDYFYYASKSVFDASGFGSPKFTGITAGSFQKFTIYSLGELYYFNADLAVSPAVITSYTITNDKTYIITVKNDSISVEEFD